jgi:hypothetical protein
LEVQFVSDEKDLKKDGDAENPPEDKQTPGTTGSNGESNTDGDVAKVDGIPPETPPEQKPDPKDDGKSAEKPEKGAGKPEKEDKNPPDKSETESKFKAVTLKGTVSERTGPHSLHALDTIVGFIDGTATVDDALAKKLKKAGYVE